MAGIDPQTLTDEDLVRELDSLCRTRLDTLRFGSTRSNERIFERPEPADLFFCFIGALRKHQLFGNCFTAFGSCLSSSSYVARVNQAP